MLLTPELIQQFNRLTEGGKIPNFCELPEIDQGILVELALAYDDETSQQLMLDALIRSDLLQSLISSKYLDVASKYQIIEQAVNDALKVLLQVKIDEWNAITPAKVLPLPEVRMLRCVNYETPSGRSETLVFRGNCETGEVIISGFMAERDPFDPRETFDPEPKPFDAMSDAGHKPSDF